MSDEYVHQDERLLEIIEREKEKERGKAMEVEGMVSEYSDEGVSGELPTYVEMFADVASKKLGIDKGSLLRAIKDLIKTEDPSMRKLIKLTQISNILSSLKRVGGLTSQVTDIGLARLASKVTSEVENMFSRDEDTEMAQFMREMKKFMMQMMIMREMTRMMKYAFGEEEPQPVQQSSGNDMVSVVASMISSLEEKLNKLEEELKVAKSEKSFFDRIKETIDTSISPVIQRVEERMASLEEKIKKLEEEKKRREMEEIINALNQQIESLKKEIEDIKKGVLTASIGAAQGTVSIADLIEEYKKRVEELDKVKKELDRIMKGLGGAEKKVDTETIKEIQRLRAEIEELRRKSDMMKAFGDLVKNPNKVREWIDTALDIMQKVNSLRNAFVTQPPQTGGGQVIEERPPPEILAKLAEEVTEGEESGGEETGE